MISCGTQEADNVSEMTADEQEQLEMLSEMVENAFYILQNIEQTPVKEEAEDEETLLAVKDEYGCDPSPLDDGFDLWDDTEPTYCS